jgi:hypothetical protein
VLSALALSSPPAAYARLIRCFILSRRDLQQQARERCQPRGWLGHAANRLLLGSIYVSRHCPSSSVFYTNKSAKSSDEIHDIGRGQILCLEI